MTRECARTVCKTTQGRLVKGGNRCGSVSNVSANLHCPAGSQPHAIVHNHPSGNASLSSVDRATMQRRNLKICVVTGSSIKCWRPVAKGT